MEAFKKDELEFDRFIDDPNDSRRGITLQAKPDKIILNNFNKFIEEIKTIELGQYFYKPDEIHVTALSIINCSSEFNLSKIHVQDYINYIGNSIKNIRPFEIEFKGITASSSCILIQGFPKNNALELMRNNLRNKFKKGNLYNSVDVRYKIKTVHCTLVRFKMELRDKKNFINFLKMNRDKYFGKTWVKELELVYTDWYHKKDVVQVLQKFKLLNDKK